MTRGTDILRQDHDLIERGLWLIDARAPREPVDREAEFVLADPLLRFFAGFASGIHAHQEEEVLFPLLRARLGPTEQGVIDAAEQAHERARGLLDALSLATAEGGAVASEPGHAARAAARDAATAYRDHVAAQLAFEGRRLLPLADHVLSPRDQNRLASAFLRHVAHGPCATSVGYRDLVGQLEAEQHARQRHASGIIALPTPDLAHARTRPARKRRTAAP